jgi:hypothetical protein
MKVVINGCFGGFNLSPAGLKRLKDLLGASASSWELQTLPRDDSSLVQVVEEMGSAANGPESSLYIVEVPDDVDWHIQEYDGVEHVAENHRTWE